MFGNLIGESQKAYLFEKIFEGNTLCMILTGDDDKILFTNKKAIEFLGYSDRELRKMRFSNIKYKPEEKILGYDIGITKIRGKNAVNHVKIEEIEIFHENEKMKLNIITDMEYMYELEIAKHNSEIIKSEFTKNLEHELRTPLNAIVGFSEILREKVNECDKNNECDEFSNLIHFSAMRLYSQINQLLSFNKIKRGEIKEESKEIDIFDLIESIVGIYKKSAEKKGLDFFHEITGELPQIIKSDLMMIEQILMNIFDNAIKFTEKGSIKFTIGTAECNEENRKIRFIISDTGIGIPDRKKNMIFQEFVQGEYFLNKRHTGLGLGLFITKELTKKLNGNIFFESRENEGSTFIAEIQI